MTTRITQRPAANAASLEQKKSYSVGASRKTVAAKSAAGWSTNDSLETLLRKSARKFTVAFTAPSPSRARAPKPAEKLRDETLANVGYRGAFVMMDLTQTVAHARRQAAMAHIKAAHDIYEQKNPGSGLIYQGERVHAEESHISVIRGIAAPLLHPSTVAAGGEKPSPAGKKALAAVAGRPAAALELDNKLTYWTGPAVGPAKYVVAAVIIKDPAGALSDMQRAWKGAGGTSVPSDMPMHLTLAYLKLDHDKLPQDVVDKVLLSLRGKDGKPAAWVQNEVYYSGRYGKEFGRAKLDP